MTSTQGSLAAPGYGSTSMVDIHDPSAQKRGGTNFAMQSIGFMTMPPLLMFALMDVTFALLAGTYLPVALVLAAICIAFAGLFGSIGRGHVKGPVYTFLSVLCFIATFAGISSGLSVQARFFGPYWNYHHRPVYTDVLATDPAAARQDAGVISFASNAIVDTFRMGNVLSSKGRKFCAAPILDESQQTVAEFWSVGMDCCEGHIGYYCDGARDVTAKSGAVIFEMNSYFSRDPYPKYMAAVKQAATRNQLTIPEHPVLVRWVKDPATVTDGLWSEGLTHVVVGILGYGVVSVCLAAVLHAASTRGQ